jgi:hypothetical protein
MMNVLALFRHACRFFLGLAIFVLAVPMASAVITGNPSKFIVLDNTDTGFSTTGTWATVTSGDASLVGPTYGYNTRTHLGAATETAVAIWSMGSFPSATGSYGFDVFIPATVGVINNAANYRLQQDNGCNGTWSNVGSFAVFDQNTIVNEGQFRRIGTMTLNFGVCYRVVLSTQSTDTTHLLYADAVRVERLFESKATIPDMPFVVTGFAAATTNITSTSNAAPLIVTSVTFACPANGNVLLTGSGESTAQSTNPSTAFIGLAYSIATNSTATDNANVVQSSALAVFNGDANRDFLNVQTVKSCTAGVSNTYRLTAYRTTPDTGPASFIWNGRLTAQFFP